MIKILKHFFPFKEEKNGGFKKIELKEKMCCFSVMSLKR